MGSAGDNEWVGWKIIIKTQGCVHSEIVSFGIFFDEETLLFRPPLWGEELYTQMGFFVQSILADRCIHRREMWVVSLKSSSKVEFKIVFFLNFVFFEELSRFKVLCQQVINTWFCSLLS